MPNSSGALEAKITQVLLGLAKSFCKEDRFSCGQFADVEKHVGRGADGVTRLFLPHRDPESLKGARLIARLYLVAVLHPHRGCYCNPLWRQR